MARIALQYTYLERSIVVLAKLLRVVTDYRGRNKAAAVMVDWLCVVCWCCNCVICDLRFFWMVFLIAWRPYSYASEDSLASHILVLFFLLRWTNLLR